MKTIVELAFAGEFEEVFKEGVATNETEFEGLKNKSDMTNDQKRKIIELAAERAEHIGLAAGTLVLKN